MLKNTKLIVGLGNPGKEFNNTRHNLGFIFIDIFSNIIGNFYIKQKPESIIMINKNINLILLKPTTFMNNSGIGVKDIVKQYKIKYEDLIIIYDDISLPLGFFKFKENGSSGGHNGMLSVINKLNTKKINRLKIGIGLEKKIVLKDWVLQEFSKEENKKIYELIHFLSKYINLWSNSDISFQQLMNLNRKVVNNNK